MNTVVIGYVPVIHEGYIGLFKKYGGVNSSLYVFGRELIGYADSLRKDIRAVQDPHNIVKMVRALNIFGNVEIADSRTFERLPKESRIVMPNEDISRKIAEEFLSRHNFIFSPVFLRWDRSSAKKRKEPEYDRVISYIGLAREMLDMAYKEAENSSDWWRHVGAVAARNGSVIASAYNHHLPSEHTPYMVGDPRGEFHKGIHIELSSAIHAEAALVSAVAGKEISLRGADLYVTTFPCPPCAKLIAYSGIRRVFFHEGYSMLEAQEILRLFGVEIIFVED